MTDTPRAGETWERVRDGRRVEVLFHGRYVDPLVIFEDIGSKRWNDMPVCDFVREFRRVEP